MRKLLLADNNPVTQRLVSMTMEPEGYHVLAFNNGIEALECMEEDRVDIVLANISMNGLDGYSLSSEMNKKIESEKAPVILLVGALAELDTVLARESGAAGQLIKPFSAEDLLGLVGSVSGGRQDAMDDQDILSSVIPLMEVVEEPLFELQRGQMRPNMMPLKRVRLVG
jgi:CheY-like chemotaxis protein